MKRRLILTAATLGLGVVIWGFVHALPPAPITAQFVGRTNYPSGARGCLIAVTNITTNNLTVLVPMDLSMTRQSRSPVPPTNVFFCPLQLRAGGGKVASFLQTEARQQRVDIYFGQSRDFSGIVYRLRRWLRLPRGQPLDLLSNPQTLELNLPKE